jgi:hypothetical protein
MLWTLLEMLEMTVLRVEGIQRASAESAHPLERCHPESSRDLSKWSVFTYNDADSIMSGI